MKKLLLSALCAFSLCANAQQKIYLCDGFRTTEVEMGDITFSSGQKNLYIHDVKYAIEDIDSITLSAPIYKEVKIHFDESSATVQIPSYVKGVTSSINGANVTINSTNIADEILYTVSGTSHNGSLTINGEYKLTIQFDNVKLMSTGTKAPIAINCGKRIGVLVKDGTMNELSDASTNAAKGAFYISGHPEFEGAGTLNVTGNAKHAIAAGEYLQLKKAFTGSININGAASDGIHCGKGKKDNEHNYFKMSAGTLNIKNCGSDCIDSDDYGHAFISGGTIKLDISQTDGKGIKADSTINISGGEITATISGNISNALNCNYRTTISGGTTNITVNGNGSKGIRCKKETDTTKPTLNGGYLTVSDGSITINVNGGTHTDMSKCYGISTDADFTQTGGDITINVTNAAAKAANIKGANNHTGGTRNF